MSEEGVLLEDIVRHLLENDEIAIRITQDTLFDIYNKVRNTPIEEAVWSRLISFYKTPLPEEIVNDLINRRVAIIDLGHSKQEDKVMWRLAELVEEALLTLAIEIYTNDSYNDEVTEKLFKKFFHNAWMMETLAYKKPSSHNKKRIYENYIQMSVEKERLEKIVSVLEVADRAKKNNLTPEELSLLYKTGIPEVLLSLAENPITSIDLLTKLKDISGIKFAKQIRHQALLNIQKK
jgi:hypothetical protein